MVRIHRPTYTWCSLGAETGAGSETLKPLKSRDFRVIGVVGAGLHNSLYYIFLSPHYLSVFYFPSEMENTCTNYTGRPECLKNQGFAGHENYTLCYTIPTPTALRCRDPPTERVPHINTTRRALWKY